MYVAKALMRLHECISVCDKNQHLSSVSLRNEGSRLDGQDLSSLSMVQNVTSLNHKGSASPDL